MGNGKVSIKVGNGYGAGHWGKGYIRAKYNHKTTPLCCYWAYGIVPVHWIMTMS